MFALIKYTILSLGVFCKSKCVHRKSRNEKIKFASSLRSKSRSVTRKQPLLLRQLLIHNRRRKLKLLNQQLTTYSTLISETSLLCRNEAIHGDNPQAVHLLQEIRLALPLQILSGTVNQRWVILPRIRTAKLFKAASTPFGTPALPASSDPFGASDPWGSSAPAQTQAPVKAADPFGDAFGSAAPPTTIADPFGTPSAADPFASAAPAQPQASTDLFAVSDPFGSPSKR